MSKHEIIESYRLALKNNSGNAFTVTFLTESHAEISLNGSVVKFFFELTDARVKSYFYLDEYPNLPKNIVSGLRDILGDDGMEIILFNGENEVSSLNQAQSLYFYSKLFDISLPDLLTTQIRLILDAGILFLDLYQPFGNEEEVFVEGAVALKVSKLYERSIRLRNRAIELHGVDCAICGMNFESIYGPIGKGFIHMHHIVRVADAGIRCVDPKTDLIPICPNCHSMIHRKNPPITPDELRDITRGE